jgi:hypothetical protein
MMKFPTNVVQASILASEFNHILQINCFEKIIEVESIKSKWRATLIIKNCEIDVLKKVTGFAMPKKRDSEISAIFRWMKILRKFTKTQEGQDVYLVSENQEEEEEEEEEGKEGKVDADTTKSISEVKKKRTA